MTNVATGMNRLTMVTAVRQLLNEVGGSYVTGTIIIDSLNRSQRRLNSDTQYYRVDSTLTSTTTSRTISLPMYVENILRVRWGSEKTRLEPTSLEALDRESTGWENATAGVPLNYYLDGGVIGFDPKPSTATSVYMYHVKTPSELANGTSVPSWIPTRFHDTIVIRAAIDIASGFDASNVTNNTRLQQWYASYQEDVKDIKTIANSRSKEYSSRITVTGYGQFRR